MKRSRLPAPAALLLLAAARPGVGNAETPVLGPLRIGMTTAEARAAAPDAAWQDVDVSPTTGRVYAVYAPALARFAGMAFDGQLEARHHGLSRITYRHEEPAINALACESRAIAMITELDGRFAPFKGPEPAKPTIVPPTNIAWNITHYKNGGIGVTPQPGISSSTGPNEYRIAAGQASTATVRAWNLENENLPRRQYDNQKKVQGYELNTTAKVGELGPDPVSMYVRADWDRDFGVCQLRLGALRMADPTDPEAIPPAGVKLASAPSIAEKHYQVMGATLPAEDRTFNFDCGVERSSGGVFGCSPADPAPSEADKTLVALAEARAESSVLDLEGYDREDPVFMKARIAVTLSPKDRRPIDFTHSPASGSSIPFLQRATPVDLENFYPWHARHDNLETSVHLVCQVQTDHSAVCGGATADDPALLPVFENGAYVIASRYVAADKTADGAATVGAVFKLDVDFRLNPAEARIQEH